ncbi:MAG: right-handed parallel beta-helix repeat-containing protein [Myxococcota bacterium]
MSSCIRSIPNSTPRSEASCLGLRRREGYARRHPRHTASLCLSMFATLLLAPAAQAQLAGPYTIGGASPDYASFAAAEAALEAQGVSGPVDFLVRAGTYTQAGGTALVLDLGTIAGVSATNRVTFRPDPASGATVDDVILERSNAPGSGPFLVRIQSDYVTLRELTLRNGDTTSTGFTNASFVEVYRSGGTRSGVEILDCVLESRRLSNVVIQLSGNTTVLSEIRVAGNRIDDFAIGINLGGFASAYAGVRIEDNVLTHPRFAVGGGGTVLSHAISVDMSGSNLVVRGSRIDYAGGAGEAGIRVAGTASNFVIEGNEIENVFVGGTLDGFTGIGLYGGGSSGRLANNMISIHTARRTGLYVSSSGGVLVAHNSIYLPSRGIDFFGGSQALLLCASNVDVFDNILIDLGTGTNNRTNAIFQQACGNTNNVFDGNLLFNAQGAIAYTNAGAAVANFAAWQALGNGANSVNRLPEVVNVQNDLHLTGCTAGDPDLFGLPGLPVSDDFDGTARDPVGPMMGAHEGRASFPVVFGESTLYEPYVGSGAVPIYLDAADVDGDLDLDLVVSLLEDVGTGFRGVGLLENQGDGTFVPLTPLDLTGIGNLPNADPLVVKARDLDGDGDVDLGVARELSTDFEVYWGAGTARFPRERAAIRSIRDDVTRDSASATSSSSTPPATASRTSSSATSGSWSVVTETGDLGVLCNDGGGLPRSRRARALAAEPLRPRRRRYGWRPRRRRRAHVDRPRRAGARCSRERRTLRAHRLQGAGAVRPRHGAAAAGHGRRRLRWRWPGRRRARSPDTPVPGDESLSLYVDQGLLQLRRAGRTRELLDLRHRARSPCSTTTATRRRSARRHDVRARRPGRR